jgi:hypothetical protein
VEASNGGRPNGVQFLNSGANPKDRRVTPAHDTLE